MVFELVPRPPSSSTRPGDARLLVFLGNDHVTSVHPPLKRLLTSCMGILMKKGGASDRAELRRARAAADHLLLQSLKRIPRASVAFVVAEQILQQSGVPPWDVYRPEVREVFDCKDERRASEVVDGQPSRRWALSARPDFVAARSVALRGTWCDRILCGGAARGGIPCAMLMPHTGLSASGDSLRLCLATNPQFRPQTTLTVIADASMPLGMLKLQTWRSWIHELSTHHEASAATMGQRRRRPLRDGTQQETTLSPALTTPDANAVSACDGIATAFADVQGCGASAVAQSTRFLRLGTGAAPSSDHKEGEYPSTPNGDDGDDNVTSNMSVNAAAMIAQWVTNAAAGVPSHDPISMGGDVVVPTGPSSREARASSSSVAAEAPFGCWRSMLPVREENLLRAHATGDAKVPGVQRGWLDRQIRKIEMAHNVPE